MAGKFTPNRRGFDELKRTPQMRDFVDGVGDDAAAQVKAKAPVDSGALRSSVKATTKVGRDGAVAEVSVGGAAFYWHFVEFGTSRKAARPFLRPGVQSALSRYGGRLGESR